MVLAVGELFISSRSTASNDIEGASAVFEALRTASANDHTPAYLRKRNKVQ
jgi:hypothetical protein